MHLGSYLVFFKFKVFFTSNEKKILVAGGAGYIGSHTVVVISFWIYANNYRQFM